MRPSDAVASCAQYALRQLLYATGERRGVNVLACG